MFVKFFDIKVLTGICYPLAILIQNLNKKHNLPLFGLKSLLEIFLFLQNHFLKDSNLGKIFINYFYGKCFTGICFSLEIVIQNHNTKNKNFLWKMFYWNIPNLRNANPKS
jgi:hypothetical protein